MLCPRRLYFLSAPCAILLLIVAVCFVPRCRSVGSHQQHNVWYNGLFISGIAVDESSGDVFFSDAAGNRVVHQLANGSVVRVYDKCGFYSPMQLAFSAGLLYVADSFNNRVAVIDVKSGAVRFSTPQTSLLHSASALSFDVNAGTLIVVDGWGLQSEMWSPDSGRWTGWVDLSVTLTGPPPLYLASVTLQDLAAGMTDPTQPFVYSTYGSLTAGASFDPPLLGATAIQRYPNRDLYVAEWAVLSQSAADGPMRITLVLHNGSIVAESTAPGQGGAAVPFHGWAMHVDSSLNTYVSDHGVDAQRSPYGRVVKLDPNGTALDSWSMSDGAVYSFTGIAYVDATLQSGSCAFWMVDRELGMGRITSNGTVAPFFRQPPVDPADNRTARLTGVSPSESIINLDSSPPTLLLIDTSSNDTTKLWRFLPNDQSYSLLNTSAAGLGANIAGVAESPWDHFIYVSDTRAHCVVRLNVSGELDASFDTSPLGFVEPAGLVAMGNGALIGVADSGYNTAGAVILFDADHVEIYYIFNDTTPPMFRPLSVAFNFGSQQLYAADSNGRVFQFDIHSGSLQAVHRTVPASSHVVSMTVSANGNLYMVDAYSRRLTIVSWDPTTWNLGDSCMWPAQSVVSSSSSSSSSSSASSWSSSSSTASPLPAHNPSWSEAAMVAAAIVGIVSVAVGTTCVYRRVKVSRRAERRNTEFGERLVAAEGHEEGRWEEAQEDSRSKIAASKAIVDDEEGKSAADDVTGPLAILSVDDDGTYRVNGKRYEFYVARYEVVAAISALEPASDSQHQQRPAAPNGQSLSIRIPPSNNSLQLPRTLKQAANNSPATVSTGSARSVSSLSNSSFSESSSASSGDYLSVASSARPSTTAASTAASDVSAASSLLSPSHIATLQSAWPRASVMFIDTVTDLSILGEGSSGVVYRGTYRGMGCVVKLPKSVVLTGLAWREWHCHLSLPPHPNLVRFLGALPMSSTNYLVLSFVRQGSLHSLLASSHSWYSRPYGVMRCVRDMCAALHHIHAAGILHRDVSCRNILVDSDGSMVLADLGLAVQAAALDDSALQTAVPVRWTSPEALATSTYSSKSDVWSLGVALWEMTTGGALPYGVQQHNTKACIRPIIAGQLTLQVDDAWGRGGSDPTGTGCVIDSSEQQLANAVRHVIQLCLTRDEQQRPDSAQLMQLVEARWSEWRKEAGSKSEQLESQWVAYHEEVQRQLGPPCEHSVTRETEQQ